MSRIASLMHDYYECLDNIASIRDRATSLKHQILRLADPGRYGRYTVFEVKEAEIHVRAHVRKAYRGIRRGGVV